MLTWKPIDSVKSQTGSWRYTERLIVICELEVARLISSSETQRQPVVVPDDKADAGSDLKSTDDRLPCINARQETNKSMICKHKLQTRRFYFRKQGNLLFRGYYMLKI